MVLSPHEINFCILFLPLQIVQSHKNHYYINMSAIGGKNGTISIYMYVYCLEWPCWMLYITRMIVACVQSTNFTSIEKECRNNSCILRATCSFVLYVVFVVFPSLSSSFSFNIQIVYNSMCVDFKTTLWRCEYRIKFNLNGCSFSFDRLF